MILIRKLGFLLILWIVILLVGIPSSPSSTITVSLASVIIIPFSTPVRITLTIGISIYVICVTVIRAISIPLSSSTSIGVILSTPFIILKVSLPLTTARSALLVILPVIGVTSASTATGTSVMSASSAMLSSIIITIPCIWVLLWVINRGQLMLVTFRL